jgi:hypothetical protein
MLTIRSENYLQLAHAGADAPISISTCRCRRGARQEMRGKNHIKTTSGSAHAQSLQNRAMLACRATSGNASTPLSALPPYHRQVLACGAVFE